MTINNLKKWKAPAVMLAAALLFTLFGYSPNAQADHGDVHIEAASTGTAVLDGNGGAELETFVPDLDLASSLSATLTASSTADATAYYGVHITSATTTGDVFWRITVSHATEALTMGDVMITEKGYFDATGGTVADSAYTASEAGGDLVFDGNAGWEVFTGDDFTNVDEITFDTGASTGVYTVTRVLMDNSTSTPVEIDAPFVFTVDLEAAVSADVTPPTFATTTDVSATATTSAGVSVDFTVTATDDTDADVEVTCDPASGSTFAVGTTTVDCTAEDDAMNTATTSFDVIVTLDAEADGELTITEPELEAGLFCSAEGTVTVSGTAALGTTVTLAGGLATSTATTTGAGTWSADVDLSANAETGIEITVRDGDGDIIDVDTITLSFDTLAPIITLNGEASMTISEDSTFTDPGVTVSDNLDATTTVTTTGSVNTANPGEYTITYTATDCAGNTATTTRIVSVEEESSGGGGGRSRRNRDVPSGLVRAGEVASSNSAVAFVLAGQVEGRTNPQVLGLAIGRFLRDLRQGDSGQDVAELQARLFSTGLYRGPITGFFGPLTAGAIRSLQAGLGITVNGQFDATTRNILNNS